MARRRGRKGDYLLTDDYYGQTCYASQLKRDAWGAYAKKPLQRNLQELASPLDDPGPVPVYRGPSYETYTTNCIGGIAPTYIGLTSVPTNPNNAAFQALSLKPGIGKAEIGCTFIVY